MPVGLNYESTHTQISYIIYFFKISKLPILKGQCGLEGISNSFCVWLGGYDYTYKDVI